MPAIYLDDGYTLDGLVPARLGYPPVRFKYRPALPEKVYAFTREPRPASQHIDAVVTLLAEHLVSWDVKGRDGNLLPVTAHVLRRIAVPVLEAMLDHVTGYTAEQRAADLGNSGTGPG